MTFDTPRAVDPRTGQVWTEIQFLQAIRTDLGLVRAALNIPDTSPGTLDPVAMAQDVRMNSTSSRGERGDPPPR